MRNNLLSAALPGYPVASSLESVFPISHEYILGIAGRPKVLVVVRIFTLCADWASMIAAAASDRGTSMRHWETQVSTAQTGLALEFVSSARASPCL